jgi:hypothetical protein
LGKDEDQKKKGKYTLIHHPAVLIEDTFTMYQLESLKDLF